MGFPRSGSGALGARDRHRVELVERAKIQEVVGDVRQLGAVRGQRHQMTIRSCKSVTLG